MNAMEPVHPSPAYRIHTDRTVIRCWNPTDAPLLKEAIHSSLDHLRQWMPWAATEPEDITAKVERLRLFRGRFDLGQDFSYGIFNSDETMVIGGTGLHPRIGEGALEIGYWIRADRINRGLGTEVAAALTQVAFAVNKVNRVEIHCDPKNYRSAAIPRKLGYTHEATLRERLRCQDGTYRDTMIWTLLKRDFLQCNAASFQVEAFDVVGARVL